MVSQRTINSFHPGVAGVKTSYGRKPCSGARDEQCDCEFSEMSQMT